MAISDYLAKAVVKGIQEQMDRCPYHDVTVIVDGTEFKCHRFYLSACSDFFRALFQSGMKEDLDNKVVLRNMSSNVFKLIIDSVYFAKGILTDDNVSSVWHAASLLQIGYLCEACENFQHKRLSVENCVGIYIESKFLCSKTLQDLSWDFVIKEFDYLTKSDDLLYLDFEDMKRLVGDDNLTIPSEDVVIETIMRWIRFNPNETSWEDFRDGHGFEKTQSTENKTVIAADKVKENSRVFRGPSKNKDEHLNKVMKTERGADCKTTLANSDVKENNRLVVSRRNRSEFLYELLAASKLLLASQACLVKLLENKVVLEDPKSFALVREGLRYNAQLVSGQDYCPSHGIYRSTSLFQNVVFTISFSNPMKYSCRTLDGEWFLLSTGEAMNCRAVTYGNEIFWTDATGDDITAYKYDISNNEWVDIESLNVPRQDHALVCLDNYIYAIGGTDCTSIERFNAEAEQWEPGSGTWEDFGNLVQPMTNLMATTCSNMIVIFGSEIDDSPSTIVQIFNPQSVSANVCMKNMSGSAKNMVSFKHGDDTFVLQENGALWKVSLDSRLLLNIEFHTMLWAQPFTLNGAVVTNQELLVFGVDIDPQMSREWEVCDFEHIKRVKIIERQGYCFLNTVIPKCWLETPDT